VRAEKKRVTHLVPPLLGFVICLGLWWYLGTTAKILGFSWLLCGLIYGYWKTNGFRKSLNFEIPPE
jgi:4-hydroxybenzoate polyprenyltransferase